MSRLGKSIQQKADQKLPKDGGKREWEKINEAGVVHGIIKVLNLESVSDCRTL